MPFVTPAPRRNRPWQALALAGSIILPAIGTPAHALTFNVTFDSTITSDPNASAIEGAINAALGVAEADISSNVAVKLVFQETSSGLGSSSTYIYQLSYYNYYNRLKAIDTASGATAAQQAALASLGTAPTSSSSGNPVNGSTLVDVTGPEARALGITTPTVPFDTTISLNTSITSPPNTLSGYYSLESVAAHEIDEALGIGGTGSTLGDSTPAVGTLDLYRYSASGTRSFSTIQTTTPYSYFSIDGGVTALAYFNQTSGADYADWLSNPIPNSFGTMVQDAYGQTGANPVLGTAELTALNVIGYSLTSSESSGVTVPEPTSLAMLLPGMLGLVSLRRRVRRPA